MSKTLPTTKYFMHPSYTYSPTLVNKDVIAATGVNFGPFGSYDNALGQSLIAKALGKPTMFTPLAVLDPDVARYQLDKNLP
jgi:hypothetical protein